MIVKVFIKRLSVSSSVNFLELAKHDIKKVVEVSITHAPLPPELADGAIVGTHNVVISFRDLETREELGVCDSTVQTIVAGEGVEELYKAWSKGYNNLPEDLRAEIETRISWVLLPSASVILEKMGLPPAVPPLILSPRKE